MKWIVFIIALMAGAINLPQNAHANSCAAVANSVLQQFPGATLWSVRSTVGSNNQTVCVISVKIAASDGKPPRIVTRRVKL